MFFKQPSGITTFAAAKVQDRSLGLDVIAHKLGKWFIVSCFMKRASRLNHQGAIARIFAVFLVGQ